MHFARQGWRDSHSAMAAVEREMSKVGLLKHEKKDVTGVKDGTVIGVDLRGGTHLHPHAPKLCLLLLGILLVVLERSMSPWEM